MSMHPLARLQRQKEYMDRTNGHAHRFAQLNGWRYTDRSFTPPTLRDNSRKPDYDANYFRDVLDHALYFKDAQRYPMAIVGQPYGDDTTDAETLARHFELQLHVPPNPRACFHAPGVCLFFVFTRPGQRVLWLPEQKLGAR